MGEDEPILAFYTDNAGDRASVALPDGELLCLRVQVLEGLCVGDRPVVARVVGVVYELPDEETALDVSLVDVAVVPVGGPSAPEY